MNPASTLPSLLAHRWIRRLVWTIAAILLTWLLAWSIVPPILKHQLVNRAGAELGRSLSVGMIEFKPWTLELTVHDLSIATQDGQSAQLPVKRIHVDAELESVLRLAPVVQALEVDAPVLRLRRSAEGRYDIDDILARLAGGPSTSEVPSTNEEPLRFALFNLTVRGGSVEVDDRPADRRHVMRELNLSLPFLSNLPSRRDMTAQLIVRGQMQLSGVDLTDGAGDPLLTLAKVSVGIDELRPLEKLVRIGTVALQSPRLQARRDAVGRLNLALASAGGAAGTPPAASSSVQPADDAWTASMAHLELRDGAVDWRDAAITPQAQLQVRALALDIDDLVWPMARSTSFKGSLAVQSPPAGGALAAAGPSPAAGGSATARLAFDGSGTDRQATGRLTVSDTPLGLAAPYMAQFLVPEVRGQLDADIELRWSDPALQLSIATLTLDRLALVYGGAGKQTDMPQVSRIAVSSANVDLDRRTLAVDRLEVTQPQLLVARGSDGRWMFESWLKTAATVSAVAVPAAGVAAPAPWTGQLAHVQVRDGAVRLDDRAQAKPVQLLQQLFARSEIAKPRDLSGKPVELATADMEALLLANIPADEQAMRDLALRRGVAVKDYLASRQLPVERLFLGATRLPNADATWSPRAELNLGTN